MYQYNVASLFSQEGEEVPESTPRRKPQSAAVRALAHEEVEALFAGLTRLEIDAGPTLAQEIADRKAFQAAPDQHHLREAMRQMRLVQRSGLAKLLLHEASALDLEQPTPRVRQYLDLMLSLSANVAAFTGSTWESTLRWLRDRLPVTVDRIGVGELRTAFVSYLDRARTVLSQRPILHSWDLLVGPSAQDIAEQLGTARAQLVAAKANTCRLTAIDAVPAKQRKRETQAAKRRAAGMKPQADRRLQARDQELATLAGVSARTIRDRRLAHTLGDYLAQKGIDVPEAVSRKCDEAKEPVLSRSCDDVDDAVSRKCVSYKEIKWSHFQETMRATYVYGRAPLPSQEEHEETMQALRAGAEAAMAEWCDLVPMRGW